MKRVCKRCGSALMRNLVGVPVCLHCHRADRGEVLALFAHLRTESGRISSLLLRPKQNRKAHA